MQTVSQIGVRVDLNVRKGATAGIYQIDVIDDEKAPVDLSGVVVSGGIYNAKGSVKLADWVVNNDNLNAGIILFSLPPEITDSLDCSNLDYPAKHTWQINSIWPDGVAIPFYYGDFRVIIGDGE